MRFAILAVMMAAGVSACAHDGVGGARGHIRELALPDSAFRVSPSQYYGIEEGETPTFQQVEENNFPLDSFGGRFGIEDFRIQVFEDRLNVDTIRTGDEDDSVEAQHLRFVFELQNEEWRFDKVLARNRCYRGGRPGVWSAGLCP